MFRCTNGFFSLKGWWRMKYSNPSNSIPSFSSSKRIQKSRWDMYPRETLPTSTYTHIIHIIHTQMEQDSLLQLARRQSSLEGEHPERTDFGLTILSTVPAITQPQSSPLHQNISSNSLKNQNPNFVTYLSFVKIDSRSPSKI